MNSVGNAKCFRVEMRTVIPGPLATVQVPGGGWNSATRQVEQNQCYIIVNAQTERYIGKNNVEVGSSSALRPNDFFTDRAEAEARAAAYHQRKCPNPGACAWSHGS